MRCLVAATFFQPFDHRFNLAAHLTGNMVTQPNSQHLRVRNRTLAETKADANFGTQTFSGTTSLYTGLYAL